MPKRKNFELVYNAEGCLPTSLLQRDSDIETDFALILLCVDWHKHTARVHIKNNSCLEFMRVYYDDTSIYEIPRQVDATKLKAYHDEHIRPLLLEISKRAPNPVDAVNLAAQDGRIEHLLEAVPHHNEKVYLDVRECGDVVEIARSVGIDFDNANLTSNTRVRRVRSALAEQNIHVWQNDTAFMLSLLRIQAQRRRG